MMKPKKKLKQKLKLKPNKRTLVRLRRVRRSRTMRMVLAGLVVVLVLAVGVGIFLQKRASTAKYMLTRLNESIATQNIEQLGIDIDFVSLSQGLAAAIVETHNTPNAEAFADMQLAVQRRLLAIFTEKEVKKKEEAPKAPAAEALPLDAALFDILKKPTYVLPPDMLTQLIAKPFVIKVVLDDLAVVETSIDHPQLQVTFPLHLGMAKRQDGWRVYDVANATELVAAFLERLKKMETDAVEAFEVENGRLNALMSMYYAVNTCQPILFPPDESGTVRLRLVLSGENMGQRDIVASAVRCEIYDQDKNRAGVLRLENARAVRHGETFEHSWFYTFENTYAEVEAMTAAKSLTCKAIPVNVSLGRGKLLYPRTISTWPGVQLLP